MKVLVTGAEGQLGRDLVPMLAREHEVTAHDLDLDITDHRAIQSRFEEIRPDVVVHAAAMTDVDGCELDPAAAYRVNALGTHNVALACQQVEAAMLYISTDFVFDGRKKEPYDEYDTPNPISVYGRSKWAGEQHVTSLVDRFYIVRTAWLYGWHGKNFVKMILRLAREKKELTVVDDQVGSPTFSLDLAEKIAELLPTGWYGIYHITNQGSCSWYDFARKILEQAGVSGVAVRPIKSDELDRPAPRPAYSVLRNFALELRGMGLLRRFEAALETYFCGRGD